jgi:8-oxo-dGTP pyrophosphatase MutT (NUDIX family)
MKVRRAAKLILETPQGVVLPYGASERRNLIGGGIDGNESPIQALGRETQEELGIDLPAHTIAIGRLAGRVTSKENELFIADWSVFYAKVPDDLTHINEPRDDIKGVEVLPIDVAIRHRLVTDMSKHALRQSLSFRY